MTKEDLEEEAEKYVKQNYCEICVMADDCKCGYIDCFTVQAYLASAEPREKRIAELEKQLEELPDKWCRNKDDYCPHLAKLEQENAELNKTKEEFAEQILQMTDDCKVCFYRKSAIQLTNAEEIIKEFVLLLQNPRTALDTMTVMNKAKQFLKRK